MHSNAHTSSEDMYATRACSPPHNDSCQYQIVPVPFRAATGGCLSHHFDLRSRKSAKLEWEDQLNTMRALLLESRVARNHHYAVPK